MLRYVSMKKYVHQKDMNGCGIACLANLLNKPYDSVKKDFEKKFYPINKGVMCFDMVKYLNSLDKNYKLKFINQNPRHFNKVEAEKFPKLQNSITLIYKSKKYPIGHYLLRTKNGWVDPWLNYPSIDKVHAGLRKKLPNNAWYVIYPESVKS